MEESEVYHADCLGMKLHECRTQTMRIVKPATREKQVKKRGLVGFAVGEKQRECRTVKNVFEKLTTCYEKTE